MKVLLDQNMPRNLVHHLVGHEVTRAFQMGWSELRNGILLQAAEDAGFQVLVTGDKNLQYQQNISARRIAIIVLSQTNWPLLSPYLQQVVRAVDAAKNVSFQVVSCGTGTMIKKEE